MKVAVIGAGAGGLSAIKQCLEEGLRPVCFEKRHSLGGVWNYEETPTKGQTSVMLSTTTNTCKVGILFTSNTFTIGLHINHFSPVYHIH